MTNTDLGSPEDGGGGPNPETANHTTHYSTAKNHQDGFLHPKRGSGRGGGLAVRRATALRMPPLGMCGCQRDPDVDRHRCRDTEPSEKQIDAYREAVGHLRDAGLTPAALLPELRLLWRKGGQDRRLAVEVAEQWGLAG